jgi:competence protein ComEA
MAFVSLRLDRCVPVHAKPAPRPSLPYLKEHYMIRLLLALAIALAAPLAHAALDLNTATKDELVALSGIGPAKAQAILDYRTQHGGFKSVDELKDVKGIGARRFEKLKPELTVVATPVKTAAREARPAAAAKAEARSHK